ncbi:sugar-binding domain-containing protein [uncultured Jannaschia sp.]|uniref:sugar-binding domain-containing protein n=1 Tax=uncultured Jannaschia sp. TaxID=293347 RepID=UPI002627B661|nr:sugar-binding domain-containing protein [uncultured Jannaschia sp.]
MTATASLRDASYERRARFAAYLWSMHDMPQAEIGGVLGGVSQSHVSRLLSHAERAGYLVIERRFVDSALSDEDRRDLRDLLAPSGLVERLEAFCARHDLPVPSLDVHQSGPGATAGAMALRRRRFGRAAAGGILARLRDQATVGVAWGRTIGAVIDGMAQSKAPRPPQAEVEVVPVCAELLLTSQRELSSSRMAERLSEVLCAAPHQTPQLTGFPAYVPRHYDGAGRDAIWHLIRNAPNYARILHGPDALVGRMDALITSVGHAALPVLGGFDDLLRAGGIDAEDLKSLIVGDIGGLLIPRPEASDADCRLIEELNGMWTGISLAQVSTIAARARKTPLRAGVIVLALRSERAATLLETVRHGLASHLVMDHDAAEGLKAQLDRQSPNHVA